MLDSVLLPIDLQHEESWNKALPQARDLLKPGGTLHLLGIVPDIGSSLVATFLPKGFEVKALQDMKEALAVFVDREFPADARVEIHVGHGHVSETILKQAADLGVDAIVMASHKPDELRSLLVSSHAHSVARHSPVSVMIVR
ncbi:universal stress protein [Paracoccus seriniphilus]|uniref:Nucleotide-binding universal stress protein, UspA family n=1 Tax=Paracoccus seriniphilus TaxID=184748 RepID=A0A239PMV1_9RHOB|nr:universal stress protein [Paracoccus seriniphilus]WCR13513.1 universal stress protein [Paracoccus seriniphilus]SNT68905.1 Nucleotide-binding universal stress protein, UspA family [Paracoccus seriniphilus]